MLNLPPKGWIYGAFGLGGLSLAGLYYTVNYLSPQPEQLLVRSHLLLFSFLFLSLISLTIPLSAYFNQRFARADWPQLDRYRLLRQGVWVGGLGVVLLYLQWLRTLTWTVALVSAGVFFLIEAFFLTRE